MKSLFFVTASLLQILLLAEALECQGYQILSEKNATNSKIGIKFGEIIKSFDDVTVTSAAQSMEVDPVKPLFSC